MIKKILLYALFAFVNLFSFSQNGKGDLRITPNGHYLQYEDGTPFFFGWVIPVGSCFTNLH